MQETSESNPLGSVIEDLRILCDISARAPPVLVLYSAWSETHPILLRCTPSTTTVVFVVVVIIIIIIVMDR